MTPDRVRLGHPAPYRRGDDNGSARRMGSRYADTVAYHKFHQTLLDAGLVADEQATDP